MLSVEHEIRFPVTLKSKAKEVDDKMCLEIICFVRRDMTSETVASF